jgi:hypothetical protein
MLSKVRGEVCDLVSSEIFEPTRILTEAGIVKRSARGLFPVGGKVKQSVPPEGNSRKAGRQHWSPDGLPIFRADLLRAMIGRLYE